MSPEILTDWNLQRRHSCTERTRRLRIRLFLPLLPRGASGMARRRRTTAVRGPLTSACQTSASVGPESVVLISHPVPTECDGDDVNHQLQLFHPSGIRQTHGTTLATTPQYTTPTPTTSTIAQAQRVRRCIWSTGGSHTRSTACVSVCACACIVVTTRQQHIGACTTTTTTTTTVIPPPTSHDDDDDDDA
jgi:hypothetical protein